MDVKNGKRSSQLLVAGADLSNSYHHICPALLRTTITPSLLAGGASATWTSSMQLDG